MKKLLASLLMMASIPALVLGCASSTTIDRTVSIEGMTINVPSNWVEDGNDFSLESEGVKNGHKSFIADDYSSGILVSYTNITLDKTPEDSVLEAKKSKEGDSLKAKDFKASLIDESVVDGARCSVYEFTYDVEDGKGGFSNMKERNAYIYGQEMHYEVSGFGDISVFDAALKSIKLN